MQTEASMKIMIDQPHGIGDVMFIQKIVRRYADMGFKVIYPLLDRHAWAANYFEPHPNVEYQILGTDFSLWKDLLAEEY